MKSNKLNRILIPLDFSETGLLALEHAIFMASLFEATIYLLHVLEEIEFPAYLNQPLFLIQKHAEVEQIITKQINDLAKKIKKENGVKTIIILCRGKVISGIKNAIIKNNINLIIMGTHGLKGFDEYFIGSNAYKTVTISPCPVITIQTHAEKIGFNTIVMPIDNSLHSRQKVDIVIELATHYKAKIHILGLINSNENIDKNKFNIKIESVEKKIKAIDYSNKIKADLITIMTDHESNLTGMFLGGFAKQIVNHSRIPVMSIRHKEGEFESINLKGIGNPFNEI
jgi:nucleotide-binding universal stress UspA family protein